MLDCHFFRCELDSLTGYNDFLTEFHHDYIFSF